MGRNEYQSTWINAAFKELKEINNLMHVCFSFVTKSLNHLLTFSIYLVDDNNKEVEFIAGEKNYFKFLNRCIL